MRLKDTAVVVALAVALPAGGCAQPTADPVNYSSPPSTVVPAGSAAPAISSSVEEPAQSGDDRLSEELSLSSAKNKEVKVFTTKFMKAMARPQHHVDPTVWWKRVASMLSDDAVDLYWGLLPDAVEFSQITGSVKVLPGRRESWWLRQVEVPTDAGRYVVIVQLDTPGISDRLEVTELVEPTDE